VPVRPSGSPRALGDAGEDSWTGTPTPATAVLDRNWRCRRGELDVVVARASVSCSASEDAPAPPHSARRPSVTVTTAPAPHARHALLDRIRSARRTLRFDVASVLAERGRPPVIDVIEAAF